MSDTKINVPLITKDELKCLETFREGYLDFLPGSKLSPQTVEAYLEHLSIFAGKYQTYFKGNLLKLFGTTLFYAVLLLREAKNKNHYSYNKNLYILDKYIDEIKKELKLKNADWYVILDELNQYLSNEEIRSALSIMKSSSERLNKNTELISDFVVMNRIGRILPYRVTTETNNEKFSIKDGDIIRIVDEPHSKEKNFHRYEAIHMQPINVITGKANERLNGVAFVPVEENGEELKVYFTWQGTKGLTNVKANIEKNPGENSYKKSEQQIINKTVDIIKYVNSKYPDKKINLVFQGHSLGGAIAQLHFNSIQRVAAKQFDLEHLIQILGHRNFINFDDAEIKNVKKLTISVCNSTGVLKKVADNSSIVADKLHDKEIECVGNFMLTAGDIIQLTGSSTVLYKSEKSKLKLLKLSETFHKLLGMKSKSFLVLAASALGSYLFRGSIKSSLLGSSLLGGLTSLFFSYKAFKTHINRIMVYDNVPNIFNIELLNSDIKGHRKIIQNEIANKSMIFKLSPFLNIASYYDLPFVATNLSSVRKYMNENISSKIVKDLIDDIDENYGKKNWYNYTSIPGEDGMTFLHQVAKTDDSKVLDNIIKHCERKSFNVKEIFNLNVLNKNKLTPLEQAVVSGSIKVFNLLLPLYNFSKEKETLISSYMQKKMQMTKNVSKFLLSSSEPLPSTLTDFQYLINYSTFEESYQYIKKNFLLGKKILCNEIGRDMMGNSPLHYFAIKYNKQQISTILSCCHVDFFNKVTKLGDVIDFNVVNNYGLAPYHMAAIAGNTEVLDFLAQKAHVSEKERNDLIKYSKLPDKIRIKTPIYSILKQFNSELLKNIFSKGHLILKDKDNKLANYIKIFKENIGEKNDSLLKYIIEFEQSDLLKKILSYKNIRDEYIVKYLSQDVLNNIKNSEVKKLLSFYVIKNHNKNEVNYFVNYQKETLNNDIIYGNNKRMKNKSI